MGLVYGRSGDPRRLYLPTEEDVVILKLDGAGLRRHGRLDPYFGTVVRDLLLGLGVSPPDLHRCGIFTDGLIDADQFAALEAVPPRG